MNTHFFFVLATTSCVKGLQCPSCTYVTTTVTDHVPLVKKMVDVLLRVFQSDACPKPVTGPTPGIDEDTCSPPEGKVSRCSFYTGTLTLKVPIIGPGVTLKIYQRGCYYSLPANIPSNGCHDRNNIKEDGTFLKQIVDKASHVLSIWNVANFNGDLCLCSDTYCKVSGVSQVVVMYPLLVVAQLVDLSAKYLV